MIRLLFGVLFAPLRFLVWLARRAWVAFVGYDVLRLRVQGALPDRPHRAGLLSRLTGPRHPALLPILAFLERARRDPRLKAVLVELGPLECGLGRAEELASALGRVAASGKLVIAYLERAGLTEYRAALGAREIVLCPSGGLEVTGVVSELTFFKGLLDKVGIRAALVARGKYKSARETFTEATASQANREMTDSIVGDFYDQLVSAVALARRLPADRVAQALDDGPLLAADAMAKGLVDDVRYLDELEIALKERLGRCRILDAKRYARLGPKVGTGRPTRVAFLQVGGPIKSGRTVEGATGPRATGSGTFVEQVEAVVADKRIKAVLLRVDSPGGSALASDVMWHALGRLKGRPIVVSMANVAASGGYFVSGLEGATVVASEASITGSIGVLGGKFDARGLYDKLGMNKVIIQRGARAAWNSDYEPFSPEELSKLEHDIDAHYRDFVTKMAKARGLSYEELHDRAQGRVYTGRQAQGVGLVDELGGLFDALGSLRTRLGLSESARLQLVVPESRREPASLSLHALLGGFVGRNLEHLEVPAAGALLLDGLARERILALLPFHLRFR
jgi:protease IV